MGFSRKEYRSGRSCSSRDLPDPLTEPMSPVSPELQVDSLPAEPLGQPLYFKTLTEDMLIQDSGSSKVEDIQRLLWDSSQNF